MQPLYFLRDITPEQLAPGVELDQQVLRDYRLEMTFRDVLRIDKDCYVFPTEGGGPDGQSGCFLAYHTVDGRKIRDPLAINWEWSKQSDRLWLGVDPTNPPKEIDLRRRKIAQGTVLKIEDDGWLIPICRAPDGSTRLPATLLFTDPETVTLPVKTEYIAYYNVSSEFIQFFFNSEYRETATMEELAQLAVFLFSLNYRYSWHEQNILGLLDTENITTVMAWSVSLFSEVNV